MGRSFVRGPALVGIATPSGTAADEDTSSGTVTLILFPKQACTACLVTNST